MDAINGEWRAIDEERLSVVEHRCQGKGQRTGRDS